MLNIAHYFFSCPKYAALRPQILTALDVSLAHINLFSNENYVNAKAKMRVLLNGSTHLSRDLNEHLFSAVRFHIKLFNRFS